ncbi:MAG TPA: D-alanyl-D-alanine carboxypeptidase family protein, partial [Methylotenera sp.]|nr:D-alanyl-D-alanine carboxypeptidase family protein [Methylotenera sp.]
MQIITRIFLALIFSSLSVVQSANAGNAQIAPPPNLAVKAYLLKDFNSDHVIASYNSNMRVEPASLTKIMTAYLSFKALKDGHLSLTQTLPVSELAWKVEGSKMFIEPNKPVTVDELLHGTIIQSGNDSSIALAEGIASSETLFAEMMNKEAQRLGMKNTHYVNATGLPDPQHYTTAGDLAILAAALIRDFPEEYQRLYSSKEYTYNKITQPNRNRLLWLDPNVDGMKTGHTESAGFCLISSAKRNDTRRIAVVLGAPTDAARATESQKLLNYGFQFFDSHLVYKQGQAISQLKVWKGGENQVASTVTNNLFVTLPKGEYKNVKAVITSTQPLIAP